MSCFICPLCKGCLELKEKAYSCSAGHSFDVSKEGYVNLLMSQKSSLKRHGDDKLMVRARRDFLEKDFYSALRKALCRVVSDLANVKGVLIDVGCGEGYYTAEIAKETSLQIYGIDISKDALRYAAKSVKNGEFAVASAFSLPFSDKSANIILNVFAPSPYEEFHRVLADDGCLVKAVPLCDHLWELKCALYDKPYKNKPEDRDGERFFLAGAQELKYKFNLQTNEDIQNLFKMTPYYYKTGRSDSEKLANIQNLEITAHFAVEVYKKR